MSVEQENLASLARGADAWDAEDKEGWLAESHPEVEYVAGPDTDRVVRGREGVAKLYDTWREMWSESERTDFERLGAGDCVLQLSNLRLRGAAGGQEITLSVGWLYRYRDGLAVYIRFFTTAKGAREAFEEVTEGLTPVEGPPDPKAVRSADSPGR